MLGRRGESRGSLTTDERRRCDGLADELRGSLTEVAPSTNVVATGDWPTECRRDRRLTEERRDAIVTSRGDCGEISLNSSTAS